MAFCPNCHEENPEAGAACPRCDGFYYVAEEALEDATEDEMIGRLAAGKYVVISLISEGGMGAVYRALQLPVEREVAFKVLRTELKDSDEGRDRFVREARAVSRLNHPNIITLYDFGLEDGRHPYMVMEYAPGDGLDAWLRADPTLDQILHVTEQILSALCEAHKAGIVHRDLKPENMIVSPTGNDPDFIKLLDFGIARMINEGATRGLTKDGEVFGTPHYMAPEQATASKDVGPTADIYAIGIILFEMICGKTPYDAPAPLSVLFMHINDPLPEVTPREGLSMIPGLVDIIQKACAKESGDRYQTAAEMLTAVQACRDGRSTRQSAAVDGSAPVAARDTQALHGGGGADGSQQRPQRQPYMTPTGVNSEVPVYDPDPSIEAPLQAPGKSPFRIAVAAFAALIFVIAVAGGLLVALSDDDANAAPEETANVEPDEQPSEESPTKPADSEETEAQSPDETEVAVKNRGGEKAAGTEPGDAEEATSSKTAEKPDDEPAPDDAEKPDPKPKKKTKTRTKKKEKKAPKKRPEKTPSSKEEDDEKPPEPKKFPKKTPEPQKFPKVP